MLTAKQEKYVQNLVKGMSQREAYRNAFSNKKATDKSIDEMASKLFNQDKILSRYNELIKKAEDEAIMSAIERKKWLTEVINNTQQEDVYLRTEDGVETKIGSRNADLNTKMKAVDLLNKMEGEYIQDIRLSGNKDNPLVAQISTIDSVAKQLLDVNEDDIDVGINS